MKKLLLSRLTKDFLNLDPEFTPSKERYRMGWGGSILASHEHATGYQEEKKRRLLDLRERLSTLFTPIDEAPTPISLKSPRASEKSVTSKKNYQPARDFYRGSIERNKKKNPDPIPYLLMETNEIAEAKPVPGNSKLIRSLCKGKGTLRRNEQGLVYLDIDDRFISMMLPYLKTRNLACPPYFDLKMLPEGAHIPVIPAREAAFQYLEEIGEIGSEFTFEIEGLYSIQPTLWPEVEQVWFFKVRSESLEKLRRQHFLTDKPQGNPFHIVIATKPHTTQNLRTFHPTMRINIAYLAA